MNCMNLHKKLLFAMTAMVSIAVISCCKNRTETGGLEKPVLRTVAGDNYNYAGSDYKGNYVWGGAMNLAWTELADNIVRDTIRLVTEDRATLAMLDKFNHPVITRKDLDEASYYVKSGFGPQTQDTINRESRKKFPDKSFDDLNYELEETDIISYAYFLKQVEYMNTFRKRDISFLRSMVQGFEADESSYQNIYILEYRDPDNFLIGIKLKDTKDQIFLAKGFAMDDPEAAVRALREKAAAQNSNEYTLGEPMREGDVFQAPFLSLSHERDYLEMLGQVLENRIEGREYYIDVMKEKIKFDMDEKGARVENEGVIVLKVTSAGPGNDKIRTMILDKPFWVAMKRFDSANPYFLLGVNNTALMKQAE